jgi:hypothetical protein
MKIVCSIDKPGQRSVMSIPGTAVMRDDKNTGKGLVAVLTPLPTTTNPVPATTNSATTKPVTTTVQDDQSGRAHRIEWRAVTLGPGNGVQQEIVSGLRPGERIALQPLALHRFAQNRGPNAAVRVASTL